MKTTIHLKSDVLGRADARTALRTQQPAQNMEDCLEQKFALDESQDDNLKEWISSLPKVTAAAISDLENNISADDFREIEEDVRKWTLLQVPLPVSTSSDYLARIVILTE